MRRALLLLGGLCGGILVACLLVYNGRCILEEGRLQALADAPFDCTRKAQPVLQFPMVIPQSDLVLQYPVMYEGPYVEDSSGDYVVDVASVVVYNAMDVGIEKANVVLQWDKGAYEFEVNMLPAGGAVLVLDRNRQAFAQHQWISCRATVQLGTKDWQHGGQLQIEEVDMGTLQFTNTAEHTVSDIRVDYKSYLPEERLYLGGITYSMGIPALAPGQVVQIRPFCYAREYTRVVRVRFQY